jgi:hypothetical protein
MPPMFKPAQPSETETKLSAANGEAEGAVMKTTMTPTVIPAQPDETATEILVETGLVTRQRKHRIIAWAIDYEGIPTPIGVTGPLGGGMCFERDAWEGIFVYFQPGGGVQLIYPIDPIMDDYYESVEHAFHIGDTKNHRRDGDRESAATA